MRNVISTLSIFLTYIYHCLFLKFLVESTSSAFGITKYIQCDSK